MTRYILLTWCFLVAIPALAQSNDRAALDAANKSISIAMQKRDLKTAARLAQGAIEICRSLFGEEARETGIAYENLGVILSTDDKYKLAIEPLKKALEIFRKDLARNGSDAAKTLEKLGNALWLSGKTQEAEATFSESVSEVRARFGDRSKETISAKLSLACFYKGSRQLARAMNELVESYAIALTTFGRESSQLDLTAIACEGSLIELLWKNDGRLDDGRKKLNGLLAYELGRPSRIQQADFPINPPLRGPRNVEAHSVVVKVWIDEKGIPTGAKLVFGANQFSFLATSAARDSKFKPSIENGKPIPDVMYISYSFIR